MVYLWHYIFRHHPLFVTVQLHAGVKSPSLKLNASCIFPMPWKWMRCIIISLGHACSVWTRARWKHPFGKHLSQVRNQLNCTVLFLFQLALKHCQESVCTATIQRNVKQLWQYSINCILYLKYFSLLHFLANTLTMIL